MVSALAPPTVSATALTLRMNTPLLLFRSCGLATAFEHDDTDAGCFLR
jgi:hypothetical protein